MLHTFKKKERLCGKKSIDNLFANGESFYSHPFAVKYKLHNEPQQYPAQLLIIVPKRKLHHAVDRNTAKRLIRECYRLQKHNLYELLSSRGQRMHLALIYTESKTPTYKRLFDDISKLIKRLEENIQIETKQ